MYIFLKRGVCPSGYNAFLSQWALIELGLRILYFIDQTDLGVLLRHVFRHDLKSVLTQITLRLSKENKKVSNETHVSR